MYEVLAAVDADEQRALSQAETIADLPSADEAVRVTVLHVFRDNDEGASVHQVHAVRRAKDRLEDAGVEVNLVGTGGDPADEILRAVAERDVDAVCLAGRKRTPAGKVLFGSVTQAVILGTDQPVLVAGSAGPDEG